MNDYFSSRTSDSGDALTRELYERMQSELNVLRTLHSKAREIMAVFEAGNARAARALIAQFRKLDPWNA